MADTLNQGAGAVTDAAHSDRRHEERLPVLENMAGIIAVDLDEGANGIILDLGLSGMMVQSITPLTINSSRTLSFTLPRTNASLQISAVVVWSDSEGRAGLRFNSLEDFVRQQLESWLKQNRGGDFDPDFLPEFTPQQPSQSAAPASGANRFQEIEPDPLEMPGLLGASANELLSEVSGSERLFPNIEITDIHIPVRSVPAPNAAEAPRPRSTPAAAVRQPSSTQPSSSQVSSSQPAASQPPPLRLTPLDKVAWTVAEEILRLTHAQGSVVAVAERNQITCRASHGNAPAVGARLQPEQGLSGECFRSGRTVICNDAEIDPRVPAMVSQRLELKSILVVPILGAKATLGLLEALSTQKNAFSEQHAQVLARLASTISDVLEPPLQAPPLQPPAQQTPVTQKMQPPPAVASGSAAAAPAMAASKPPAEAVSQPNRATDTAAKPTPPLAKTAPPAVDPTSKKSAPGVQPQAGARPTVVSTPAGTSTPPANIPDSANVPNPKPPQPGTSPMKAPVQPAAATPAANIAKPFTPLVSNPQPPSKASGGNEVVPLGGSIAQPRVKPKAIPAKGESSQPVPAKLKAPLGPRPPASPVSSEAASAAAASSASAPSTRTPPPEFTFGTLGRLSSASDAAAPVSSPWEPPKSTRSAARTVAMGGIVAVALLAVAAGLWTVTHKPANQDQTATAQPREVMPPAAVSAVSMTPASPQAASPQVASLTGGATQPAARPSVDSNVSSAQSSGTASSSASPRAGENSSQPRTQAPAAREPQEEEEEPAPARLFAAEVNPGAIRMPSASVAPPAPAIRPPAIEQTSGVMVPQLPGSVPTPRLAAPSRTGQVSPPQIVHRVNPDHPREARGVKGTLVLSAVVDVEGKPGNIQVVSGNPIFAQAARVAFAKWRYRPATQNGNPVEARTEVRFVFEDR